VRLQKATGESDELGFAPSVLDRPVEYDIVGNKRLPVIAVPIERRVVLLNEIAGAFLVCMLV
jgi:hypothetical protein